MINTIIPTQDIDNPNISIGNIKLEDFRNDSISLPVELSNKIDRTINVIQDMFSRGEHLLVACSFGKDSSVMLCIFLLALKRYVQRHGYAPECIVVNSNTLVENPIMDAYSRLEAKKVQAYCEKHNLPVRMDIVEPNLSNNYLVNIIGGRIIAVDAANDSKCSVMLKVDPINKHKKRIFKRYGKNKVVSLVGTRFDESKERARKMRERGDSYSEISTNKNGDRVLSPIADFTLDNIFEFIGWVRAGRIESYSGFDELVDVYRESNGGECMVITYATGSASKQPCGARNGCFICARVANDTSMENMLKESKNSYMRPLFELRSYIIANQYDPSKRNWLSRTVNPDGTVHIKPNSYSPDYCEELLRIVLTIQVRENAAADKIGISPRFQLLRLEDVIALEILWSRYGYHEAAAVIKIFDEVVVKGIEYDIPVNYPYYSHKQFPRVSETVPFSDKFYGKSIFGLRDVEDIAADCEGTVSKRDGRIYSNVSTSTEFSVDPEGAELFFEYEYDNFLAKYADKGVCPTQVYHYFMRLGTVSLSKGGHSENDRMLQMANQIHRSNLVGILNDPVKLYERLTNEVKSIYPVQKTLF